MRITFRTTNWSLMVPSDLTKYTTFSSFTYSTSGLSVAFLLEASSSAQFTFDPSFIILQHCAPAVQSIVLDTRCKGAQHFPKATTFPRPLSQPQHWSQQAASCNISSKYLRYPMAQPLFELRPSPEFVLPKHSRLIQPVAAYFNGVESPLKAICNTLSG